MSCFKMTMRFLFSHLGLLLMLVGYCCLGAVMFKAVEGGKEWDKLEKGRDWAKLLEAERANIADKIRKLQKKFNPTEDNLQTIQGQKDTIRGYLDTYHDHITKGIRKFGYDGKVHEELEYKWAFTSAVVFTVTTIGLIGYGHVAPVTEFGRFLVMLYSVFGIPLALLFLSNIGELFSRGLSALYKHLCCFPCRHRRNRTHLPYHSADEPEKSEPEFGSGEQEGVIGSVEGGSRFRVGYDPNDPPEVPDMNEYLMPVSLIFLVMMLYILTGTLLFHVMEGWPIATSTYFSFVTLTTLGFGDFVPGFTDVGSSKGQLKLAVATIYIVMGLGVLGMGINVMVAQIALKVYRVKKRIAGEGMVDEDGDGVDDNEERMIKSLQTMGR